jgi:hypothetical protein
MRRGVLVAGAAALLSASGCASYYYGDAAGPDTVTPLATAALLKANQQAVDKLLEAAPLEPGARFLVATLVNVDRLGASSRFGRISSEQIAGRLVQRGVPVVEVRLRDALVLQPGEGELLLSRQLSEVSRTHQASTALVGTYAASSRQVYVSLKLVRPQGNVVVAAQDYVVPMTAELRGMLAGH